MKIKIALSVLAIGLAGYAAYSPVMAIQNMKTAAKEQDAETLREYIDFDRLRENVKDTIRTSAMKQMGSSTEGDKMAAGFAMMMMNAMIDPMVDAVVSPKGIASMLQAKQPVRSGSQKSDTGSEELNTQEINVSYSYKGYSTFVVDIENPENKEQKYSFVLDRTGVISGWKLVDISLPL